MTTRPSPEPTPPAGATEVLARAKTLTPDAATVAMSLLMRRAIDAAWSSEQSVANALPDCSKARVHAWCNPLHPHTIPLHRVEQLRRARHPVHRELIALLDELDGGPGEAALERAALVIGRESGELQASVLEAIADGVIDAGERKRIDREAADVGAAVMRLRRGL